MHNDTVSLRPEPEPAPAPEPASRPQKTAVLTETTATFPGWGNEDVWYTDVHLKFKHIRLWLKDNLLDIVQLPIEDGLYRVDLIGPSPLYGSVYVAAFAVGDSRYVAAICPSSCEHGEEIVIRLNDLMLARLNARETTLVFMMKAIKHCFRKEE